MVEWIQTEKIEETKQMPRSIVRVYFELEPYEDETKTVISLSIFTNRALRDSLLDKLDDYLNSLIETKVKEILSSEEAQ